MRVGVIGLGRMGSAIARRVLKAGFELTVYNRSASKTQEFAQCGVWVADTVVELSQRSDLVITMLSDDTALQAIAQGEGGLCEALAPGAVHVAMGTHSVDAVNTVAAAHHERRHAFISAPVLGRPEAVEAGELGIVLGGESAVIERCMPVFEEIGRRVFHAGRRPDAAAALKLSNNFVLACAIEAMAETFALVRKYEIDPEVLYSILTEGLFAAPAYKVYGRIIANQDYDKVGFSAVLGLKDLNLMQAAAQSAAVPLPSANIIRDHLITASAQGLKELDWSVIARVQAKNSGLDA